MYPHDANAPLVTASALINSLGNFTLVVVLAFIFARLTLVAMIALAAYDAKRNAALWAFLTLFCGTFAGVVFMATNTRPQDRPENLSHAVARRIL